jgi:hypothetical protein
MGGEWEGGKGGQQNNKTDLTFFGVIVHFVRGKGGEDCASNQCKIEGRKMNEKKGLSRTKITGLCLLLLLGNWKKQKKIYLFSLIIFFHLKIFHKIRYQ